MGPKALMYGRLNIRNLGDWRLISDPDVGAETYVGCQALLLGKVVSASAEEEWIFTSSESTGSTNGDRAGRRAQHICRAG